MTADACRDALAGEQGAPIKGRAMHLEISKPQKPSRVPEGDRRSGQRSATPDFERERERGGRNNRGARDRAFDGRRDRDPRERRGGRDDFRQRSPSPRGFRGNGRGGRDEYRGGRDRSPQRYGASGRNRSRSRSPYGGHRKHRSPSPPRQKGVLADEDLPLPRRNPNQVPDLQLILFQDLDRVFISYIEKAFNTRGIRTDILILSPGLDIAAVVRRQILEGVLAVSCVTKQAQTAGRIPLQIFDRKGGADNVRYDEYDNLEPAVAAELVFRSKQQQVTVPPISQPGYGQPQPYQQQQQNYGPAVQQFGAPAPVPAVQNSLSVPNIASMIASLDPASLQKLLTAIQPAAAVAVPQPQQPQPDLAQLAALLGGAVGASSRLPPPQSPQQQQFQGYPPQAQQHVQQQQNPFAALANNPAGLASLLAGAAAAGQQQQVQQGSGNGTVGYGAAPQNAFHSSVRPSSAQAHQAAEPNQTQPAQQVQNIMEQLAKWKQ
jgi:hypothetical protein